MSSFRKRQLLLRKQGEYDFRNGKPITSFPGRGERERAAYEIGWRNARFTKETKNLEIGKGYGK